MADTEEFLARLPSREASQRVFADIAVHAFFTKLASVGISPETEEEAASMLKIAEQAVQLAQHPVVKQATGSGNRFAALESGMSKVAGELGLATPPGGNDAQIDELALAFAGNPAVYGAALSLSRD